MTYTTNQANEQADDLMVGVTSHESQVVIQSWLNAYPNYLWRWFQLDAHQLCFLCGFM